MLMRAAVAAAVVLIYSAASAEDALKVSVAGRGAFENQVSEVGERQGFFKKHDLALEVLYSRGSRETLAAVTTGATDIGTSVGTLGALGAFGKGAPIRLIGGSMIGVSEFWYVPVNSPIKSLKQAAGKTVAHSATGSASNLMVLALQELHGIKVRPVATGNPAATFAQVMSGQVDVGYSVPPFAVAELEQGKIRIIARGNDIPALAKQTVRFIVVNADALGRRPDAFRRYVQGYRDTVEWMFSPDPQALAAYSAWAGVLEGVARRTRDDFMRRENMLPDQLSGLDAVMADAVTYKFIPAPLDAEALKTLLQLQEPIR
jgi:ABC-type nitrate/sulfonate/bicarbonate transport system substrate-binding protein